ncbi:MAG: zinc ABC transporter substrate-binding protein [Actinobacteria bacterium]|nr:zinc ABC transporter substrate-binding protein [Actinomycetota bacterium]MTA66063.1 zinc ABC transporter substrate-binding protein [Actinomycetota bacterium]
MVVATGCASTEKTSTSQSVGCGFGETIRGRPLNIATTVAPITSIVANIVGGTGSIVAGVVPEGTNSHTFEPKPSDAATLESADIIFINGLVLEEPTKDLAMANIKTSANICELGTEVLPESEYIYDFSFPKEGGKPNPHLWTNPPMAKQYAQVVRDVLVRRDPTNAAIYESNFSAFALKIDALDDAIEIATATIPEDQRKLLTYHDAYAYFAKNYGFTVIGAIQPSSFDEPTPKEIGELILQVKNQKVKAIFGSEVFPSTVLEQIGAETAVRYVDVLRDDDLIGEPGDPEHSWLGLMRFNFVTIVEALGGDASALKSLDVRDVVKDEAKYPQ